MMKISDFEQRNDDMSDRRYQLLLAAALATVAGHPTAAAARPMPTPEGWLGRAARAAGLKRPKVLYRGGEAPAHRWGVVLGKRASKGRLAVVALGATPRKTKSVILLPGELPELSKAKIAVTAEQGYLGRPLVRLAVRVTLKVGARTTFHILRVLRAPASTRGLELVCTIDGSWRSDSLPVRRRGGPTTCGGFGKGTVRIVAVPGAKVPILRVDSRGYAGDAVPDGGGGCARRSPIHFREGWRIEIPATGRCTKKRRIKAGPPGP